MDGEECDGWDVPDDCAGYEEQGEEEEPVGDAEVEPDDDPVEPTPKAKAALARRTLHLKSTPQEAAAAQSRLHQLILICRVCVRKSNQEAFILKHTHAFHMFGIGGGGLVV